MAVNSVSTHPRNFAGVAVNYVGVGVNASTDFGRRGANFANFAHFNVKMHFYLHTKTLSPHQNIYVPR